MSLNTLYQPELQTSAINQNLSFFYPRLLSISASLISTCRRSAKTILEGTSWMRFQEIPHITGTHEVQIHRVFNIYLTGAAKRVLSLRFHYH